MQRFQMRLGAARAGPGYGMFFLTARREHQMDQTTAKEVPATIQRPVAQPTIGGSVYVKPRDMAWEPTQFDGISIKVLYEDREKGEMTCLLKWEPGATLPMHKHPEIEQTYIVEGSFHDHDGGLPRRRGRLAPVLIVSRDPFRRRAGILAICRKPTVFQHSSGYAPSGAR